MARRRMISQTIVYDEEFNRLSIEAQLLFFRMLAVADDCGVVPASDYALTTLTNPPRRIKAKLFAYLKEIVAVPLGSLVEYEGKQFFIFKQDAYRRIQSYIINKREKSEYLKITAEAFDSIAFKSIEGHMNVICGATRVESRELKVESRKKKVGEFLPPKIEEVIAYFKANGYREDVAQRAFRYYADASPPWTDSRGRQVLSWKSKMQANWFKPENQKIGGNGASDSSQQYKQKCEYCGNKFLNIATHYEQCDNRNKVKLLEETHEN